MSDITKLIQKFRNADLSNFPNFENYDKPLEMGLWVLWIAKDKLGESKLTSEQIITIIIEVQETSIDKKSIINAFTRAGNKIHTFKENNEIYYEIMKKGKDHLRSLVKEGYLKLVYFEPGKQFSSKRELAQNILKTLKGNIKIVDPYCGERTLDILKDLKNTNIKVLTRIDNLAGRNRSRFLRDLRDFKIEKPNIEFRDYPNADIHDRYIISSDSLIILGHSIKDLGKKESFAISLKRNASKNIIDALINNFNNRWNQSIAL